MNKYRRFSFLVSGSRFLALSSCILALFSCRHPRTVNTSFYYWKTGYKANPTENNYLQHLHVHKLYVRIMDIDTDENSAAPVPVSPIEFKAKLPDTVGIVPVVFIVNDILKNISQQQIAMLANKIVPYVEAKAGQAGKRSFDELQIDCDWTSSTRDNYFELLRLIKANLLIKGKTLSVTLRLHQVKNQRTTGIPPADRGMLMCYNMGNLRKYGSQNSILELSELKRYLNKNIRAYPMPIDVGLPLFSWAVAFRNEQYAGISKKIKINDLNNKNQFIFIRKNIFKAAKDLPEFGLIKADEVRWEAVAMSEIEAAASYISPLLKTDTVNIIYFHLDETVIKPYAFPSLQKVDDLFR